MPKTVLPAEAINHATEHRAQITVMLTQLGSEPDSMDGWSYLDESYAIELAAD